MEHEEIYKVLRSIKRYLFVFTCVICSAIGLICFSFIQEYWYLFKSSPSEVSNCAEQKEEDLRITYYEMERNRQKYAELRINKEFEELLRISREHFNKNQNDFMSLYSEGEALYFLGDYEQAKEKFLATLDMAPAYKIYIDPYLENIKNKQN